MKNILKVTILFCLIVGIFVVPSFAFEDNIKTPKEPAILRADLTPLTLLNQPIPSYYPDPGYLYSAGEVTSGGTNYRVVVVGDSLNEYYVVLVENTIYFISENSSNDTCWCNYSGGSGTGFYNASYSSEYSLYYKASGKNLVQNNFEIIYVPIYSTLDAALSDIDSILHPAPTPTYNKNPNVDEFLANTLISMGVMFDTPADALSYAAYAWDWCINEDNRDDANAFDEWNIDAFVSYCNAQSNNYLNWYNGYKVSADVTKALGVYIRSNIQLLTGLPSGVSSLTPSYLPIGHYGSGFNSGATNPSAQTFYPAQTITYFNGEYVKETNDISTSQFLYTPPDVRRFLGYPGSSPTITPSSPTGTGTITDDPNNPDQKNITINFPALDWLADAIKSILDFLRDAFTTLANLLTQLLDAILGLFSDAFEGLTEFGEGFIDFLQTVFTGFSDLFTGFVPTSLATILVSFLALNIGLGLITFILKGH